ncbi:hypothetical protein HMP0015_3464 [Acinetobacter haemolyticus ATCC 19194]|uniref:Uncharacterized protein n=1 Tax=Acinetobacter haemolyticus ATCC 19194 TaxID=707232 RepID=D4XUS2_ACIHA|nr:hypothetical protein HMPREF0023_0713 [Acinetobacter sp. ATCC 27244]EFF81059.1 hypothetical protein HMP0015_3464 [Acinetobacter haemolyticus ATCC 19194]
MCDLHHSNLLFHDVVQILFKQFYLSLSFQIMHNNQSIQLIQSSLFSISLNKNI